MAKKDQKLRYATSGWTLQESGYAIAKKQKLILLVEDGVGDIGGLHADWERIPFSREDLTEAKRKLTETVNNLALACSRFGLESVVVSYYRI